MNRSTLALVAAALVGAVAVEILSPGDAEAQVPVECIPAQTVVESAVTRGTFDFLPDGGCFLTADINTRNVNTRFLPAPRLVKQAALCNAVRAATERAAKLDLGITDAGTP